MKKIVFVAVATTVFLSSVSFAATRFQFLPGGQNGMVFVKTGGFDGSTDTDFTRLWDFMDVPPQESIVGLGKKISTGSQDFSLICGQYQTQCQVFLKKSPRVVMNPSQKLMKFEVHGEEADYLFDQLIKAESGQAEFITEDRKFRLFAVPGHFLFEASENGI